MKVVEECFQPAWITLKKLKQEISLTKTFKKVILITETSPIDLTINERIDVISGEYIFSANSFEEFFDSDEKDMHS
jgi:hypothetical protein